MRQAPSRPPGAREDKVRLWQRRLLRHRRAPPQCPHHAGLQVIHLMRHGVTEMNVYLAENDHEDPDFMDPLMWGSVPFVLPARDRPGPLATPPCRLLRRRYDTRLTRKGGEQAMRASHSLHKLHPPPEVSPCHPCHPCRRPSCSSRPCAGLRQPAWHRPLPPSTRPPPPTPPQLLVISPLTRALETAESAFRTLQAPSLIQPLCRERLYHSSDVGRHRSALQQEFPQ
jgi:hypothetical protein